MFHAAIETADSDSKWDGAMSAEPYTHSDLPRQGSPDGGWDGLLHFQRCRWCRTASFRRLLCPVCASPDMAWERSCGTGVIHRLAVVGQSGGAPRVLATVDMSEGFQLRARIIGAAPVTVRVGNQVELATEAGLGPQELLFRLCHVPLRR